MMFMETLCKRGGPGSPLPPPASAEPAPRRGLHRPHPHAEVTWAIAQSLGAYQCARPSASGPTAAERWLSFARWDSQSRYNFETAVCDKLTQLVGAWATDDDIETVQAQVHEALWGRGADLSELRERAQLHFEQGRDAAARKCGCPCSLLAL